MARAGAAVALSLLVAAAVAAGGWWSGRWQLPPRWNPWAPLDIAEARNLLTGYKLGRLANDPALCRAVLAASDLRYEPVPDRHPGPTTAAGCGWRGAVLLRGAPTPLSPAAVLTCPAAVALAIWDRHTLQPLARERLGEAAVRIENVGSYACRDVAGTEARSRHATADALDVTGIVLADGRRLRVLSDWPGDGMAAAFLRELHDGACRSFDGVLGPDYNAAHRDHFHLERGGYRMCR